MGARICTSRVPQYLFDEKGVFGWTGGIPDSNFLIKKKKS